QTWLVKRSTFSFGEGGGGGAGGANLPPGTTVFFHLPSDYAGQPVKLSFTDADGKLIRSFMLPQKSQGDRPGPRRRGAKPGKLRPGMNSFTWDFRYPTGVEVQGAYHAGRSVMPPIGPEVVPGTYYAVLTYGGATQKQPFEVKLDPNLSTTQADLQERFDLLMKLRNAMDRLDDALNHGTSARHALQAAMADKQVSERKARKVVADLGRDIDASIDFRIQSSRGFDVFPPRLREWLTGIA